MKKFFLFLLSLLIHFASNAQELFPLNEPASNVPKGVIGVRALGESHQEINAWRGVGALRLMYGLTSKLTVMLTASTSNHHGDSLPYNLATHTHIGNQTIYYASNVPKGIQYPYRYNGLYGYAKYRFITVDGQNKHFRMAVYGEWSNVNVTHDEAEPTLLDDTKGYGGGLITTLLRNRFAASLTSGVIVPGTYQETEDLSHWTGILGPTTTIIQYGRAIQYNLSFGYRLFPKKYTDYGQNNWNVYLEFMGKSYEAATVSQNGIPLEIQSPLLKGGNYLEVHPGIQKITDSNLRIDFSLGFNLINRSYVHYYPMYMVGIQRYFYIQKNKSGKAERKN